MKTENVPSFIWDLDRDSLALIASPRPSAHDYYLATAYRRDRTRWVAVVAYDTPGTGAACVRADAAEARAWIEETVASAWPAWRSALNAALERCAS